MMVHQDTHKALERLFGTRAVQAEQAFRTGMLECLADGLATLDEVVDTVTRLTETDWHAAAEAYLNAPTPCGLCRIVVPRRTLARAGSQARMPNGETIVDERFCPDCLVRVRDAWLDVEAQCAGCMQWFQRRDTVVIHSHEYGVFAEDGRFCLSCQDAAIVRYRRVCDACGSVFRSQTRFALARLCPDCYYLDLANEEARVSGQLSRARKESVAATLTLPVWIATVRHFGGKCAYCQETSFVEMDHVRPIIKGGGTTADNCVPACHACNSRKSDTYPFDTLFPSEVVARVCDYLGTLR